MKQGVIDTGNSMSKKTKIILTFIAIFFIALIIIFGFIFTDLSTSDIEISPNEDVQLSVISYGGETLEVSVKKLNDKNISTLSFILENPEGDVYEYTQDVNFIGDTLEISIPTKGNIDNVARITVIPVFSDVKDVTTPTTQGNATQTGTIVSSGGGSGGGGNGGGGDTTPPANNNPISNFTANTNTGNIPLTVLFNASASSDSDGNIVNYSWDFGDASKGDGIFTLHTFNLQGNYQVNLTVKDNDGAIDTSNITIIATVAVPVSCGNDIQEAGEMCDGEIQGCKVDGYAGTATCNAFCTGFDSCIPTEWCGDFEVDGFETCDDGNLINGDGCSITCLIETVQTTLTITGETSSTLNLAWPEVVGANYNIYIAPELGSLNIESERKLIVNLPSGTTTYPITGLAAGVDTFVRVEPSSGSAMDVHGKTVGGQRSKLIFQTGNRNLDTPLREVHLLSPNIIQLVMKNEEVNSYSRFVNWYGWGVQNYTGFDWQEGTWSVERNDGSFIPVTKVYRESVVTGVYVMELGYQSNGHDNIIDVDHKINLVLSEPIGNKEILRIVHTGDAGNPIEFNYTLARIRDHWKYDFSGLWDGSACDGGTRGGFVGEYEGVTYGCGEVPIVNMSITFSKNQLNTDLDVIVPFSDKYLETSIIQLNQVGYSPRAKQRWAYVSGFLGADVNKEINNLSLTNFPSTVYVLTGNENRNIDTTTLLETRAVPDRCNSTGIYDGSCYVGTYKGVTYNCSTGPPVVEYSCDAGTEVRQINLSALQESDETYRVYIPGVGVSFPTMVNELGPLKAFYVTTRGLYHNRWGRDLQPQWTDWSTREPDHQYIYPADPPEDAWQSDFFFTSSTPTCSDGTRNCDDLRFPFTGGHHDAGDFDQRAGHYFVPVLLLRTYEMNKDVFTDSQLSIPESGNGIPDLLDEALWNIKAWEQLQEPNGGVRAGVESFRHPWGKYYADEEPESEIPFWTYSVDINHTSAMAGIFAQSSRLLKDFDQTELCGSPTCKSDELLNRSIDAYNYAYAQGVREENLGFMMYAASEIYALTNNQTLKQRFESGWDIRDKWGEQVFNNLWPYFPFGGTGLFSVRYDDIQGYLGNNPDPDRLSLAQSQMSSGADSNVLGVEDRYAHRTNRRTNTYTWGKAVAQGEYVTAAMERLQLDEYYNDLTPEKRQEYFDAISMSADYALGGNPAGRVWTTGLGSDSPQNPDHADSIAFSVDLGMMPMHGITVYGPSKGIPKSNQDFLYYPQYNTRPPLQQYSDIWHSISSSEFTVTQTQAPQTYLFGALVKDGLMPPIDWLPGQENHQNPLPTLGNVDLTPPTIPIGVNAVAVSDTKINLFWDVSTDLEADVLWYKIYRDGLNIATTRNLTFLDTGLSENTPYSYEVTAENIAFLGSNKSLTVNRNTLVDNTGPSIINVVSQKNPDSITITFSEDVDEGSATTTSNYLISPGITVTGATLIDSRTVKLTTDTHITKTNYTLDYSNILDTAVIPNSGSSSINYEFIWEPNFGPGGAIILWDGEIIEEQVDSKRASSVIQDSANAFKGEWSFRAEADPWAGGDISLPAVREYRQSLSNYDTLMFWVKINGTGETVKFRVSRWDAHTITIDIDPYIQGNIVDSNYKLVTIPFADMPASNTSLAGPDISSDYVFANGLDGIGFGHLETPNSAKIIYADEFWAVDSTNIAFSPLAFNEGITFEEPDERNIFQKFFDWLKNLFT